MQVHVPSISLTLESLITAAIIGASGYSGAELVRMLSSRSDVQITHTVASTSAGKKLSEIYPAFTGKTDVTLERFDPGVLQGTDFAFIALPSGEAMNIVPQLWSGVERIVDLGGDFRLSSPALYKEFYQHEHTAVKYLTNAVYGLPEINKCSIETARLVANPGCYPTSAILALLPALKHDLIAPEGIVINSLSGVSGAGRSASVDLSFSEVNENIRAYKIGRHQHIPEIHSVLERMSGKSISLSFVPHLVPITRGIYTTIHSNLIQSLSLEEVYDSYNSFYADAPFVRIRKDVPQIRDVARTNYCDIHITIEPRTQQLIIISVIDNLVKGAAGQAIQNMNIMLKLPQEQGLLS